LALALFYTCVYFFQQLKKGLDSGFGEEDGYGVYDKPWRETEAITSSIYRPSKNIDKEYGDDFDKALSTKRFVPDKGFEGADKSSATSGREGGPVAFEQHHHDTNFDPFQIDDFLGNLKKGGGSSNATSAAAESNSSNTIKEKDHEPNKKKRRN
jgi:hypothetical protein